MTERNPAKPSDAVGLYQGGKAVAPLDEPTNIYELQNPTPEQVAAYKVAKQRMADHRAAVLAEAERHDQAYIDFRASLKAIRQDCPHLEQEQLFSQVFRCLNCKVEIHEQAAKVT